MKKKAAVKVPEPLLPESIDELSLAIGQAEQNAHVMAESLRRVDPTQVPIDEKRYAELARDICLCIRSLADLEIMLGSTVLASSKAKLLAQMERNDLRDD